MTIKMRLEQVHIDELIMIISHCACGGREGNRRKLTAKRTEWMVRPRETEKKHGRPNT